METSARRPRVLVIPSIEARCARPRIGRHGLGVLVCLILVLLLVAVLLAGCAQRDPVRLQGYRALDAGLDAIKLDAELGVRVRSDPALAAAAGVPAISPAAADFARETLAYHRAVIDWLTKREEGTLQGNEPFPAGPTFRVIPR
jgi:hypothetical protein